MLFLFFLGRIIQISGFCLKKCRFLIMSQCQIFLLEKKGVKHQHISIECCCSFEVLFELHLHLDKRIINSTGFFEFFWFSTKITKWNVIPMPIFWMTTVDLEKNITDLFFWGDTLQGTNISPKNGILKMIFLFHLFPRWDMLVPWRVSHFVALGDVVLFRLAWWTSTVWLAPASPVTMVALGNKFGASEMGGDPLGFSKFLVEPLRLKYQLILETF